MKDKVLQHRPLVVLVITMSALTAATTHAERSTVYWERIEGIDPNPLGGQVVAGINPVTFPWSASRGRARLDVTTGRLHFDVEGLSIGASPTPLAAIGTTGVVTEITGTILCNATGEYVDSDPVELSAGGDASFYGHLPYTIGCSDESWVFLLRVAAVVSGAPPIAGRWLAHGAARSLRERAPRQDDN